MTNDRLHQVESACTELAAAQHRVTFDAVAERTHIGRATLYRNPELRAVIEEHRQHTVDPHTLTGLATQIDQLRQALDAVAARVRSHEEQLRRQR